MNSSTFLPSQDVMYHIPYNKKCDCLFFCGKVLERAVLSADNAYLLPTVIIRGHSCKTNLPSNTAFRGFGAPQGMLVAETWMTQIAHKCGLTQEEVRSNNTWCSVFISTT